MANNLYFSRDTKLYATFKDASGTIDAAFELPILDGFSFSQANNTSEITLSEMESSGGISRRGRRLFNDSLAPAEWSFSTYVRPFTSDGTDYVLNDHHAVEEVLWAQMAGADNYDGTGNEFQSAKFSNALVTTSDGTDLNIDFSQSNRAVLQPMDLYFVMETNPAEPVVYKIQDAVVNEATITFDVDGIATIEWSGFGKDIKDWTANTTVSATPTATTLGDIVLDSTADNQFNFDLGTGNGFVTAKDEGVSATDNFIRNRLTQLSITADASIQGTFDGAGSGIYNLTLTGGSITISNNIEYLTPEEIGKVNLPLENVTGARSVSGSFTCYVNYVSGSNGGTSTDFFNDFKSTDALDIVTNDFDLTFKIGGSTGKRLEVNMPKSHIEIPVTNIEDVISFETNFHGLGTSISGTDEVALAYFGA
jgi:hypothetical protein